MKNAFMAEQILNFIWFHALWRKEDLIAGNAERLGGKRRFVKNQ